MRQVGGPNTGTPGFLDRLSGLARPGSDIAEQARLIADAIRVATGHRWVGVYRVDSQDAEILGWSGEGPPAHTRFPAAAGLTGVVVAMGETVVSNDVARDPRYLTAFSSTRSEMIVPVIDRRTRAVVGTIDVESDRTNAFEERDRELLERCARAIAPIYETN
jgi:L-methionine (R)-S-oxide reductase